MCIYWDQIDWHLWRQVIEGWRWICVQTKTPSCGAQLAPEVVSSWGVVHVSSPRRGGGQGGMLVLIMDGWLQNYHMEDWPWNGTQIKDAMDLRISSKSTNKYVLSITIMCTLSIYAHDDAISETPCSKKYDGQQQQYLMYETSKTISKQIAWVHVDTQNKPQNRAWQRRHSNA